MPKPYGSRRGIKILEGLAKWPSRLKDHPQWCHEDKPWGLPRWPATTLHASIENHYLYRTTLKLGIGNYANLGVFRGGSTGCIAHGLKELGGGKVYGIDWFQGKNGADHKEKIQAVFDGRGLSPYTELCQGDINEWVERLKDTKFKFIFVDASHQYENVVEDFNAWSPLVEPGGLIAFHDVNMDTVDEAITNVVLPDWDLVDHVWRIKSFKRKGE